MKTVCNYTGKIFFLSEADARAAAGLMKQILKIRTYDGKRGFITVRSAGTIILPGGTGGYMEAKSNRSQERKDMKTISLFKHN